MVIGVQNKSKSKMQFGLCRFVYLSYRLPSIVTYIYT